MSPAEHDRMRAVEDNYWWYRVLRKEVTSLMHPPRPGFSVLDAGCGSGGMLAALARRFSSAVLVGMDLSEHALALTARRDTGATLTAGSVNELPFPSSQFDFVLSLDVLTHQGVDDHAAVREAYRVLQPGGQLIVNVAALDFLQGSHDIAVKVDRRYTRLQFAGLLREAGFCIIRLTYWNMSLLPVIALMRWWSRKTPSVNAQSDFAPLPPGLNAILSGLVRLEFMLSSVFPLPFGTSLLALARKP